jgi:hypothetical protein
MLDADGVVKVMDFGLARLFSPGQPSLTETNAILGSVHYMSPEQIRAEPLDARSDIYALGVIAFELFTGVLPFSAETPLGVMQQHLSSAPPIDGRLPRALQPVLQCALAKQRAQRYASAAELLRALDHVRADGDSTTVVLPQRPRRTARQTEAQPFGNPDGSRADLDDVLEGFVAFGERAVWGDLASRPDDLSARVIVGRKGSGKTVYLRRLHAHVAGDPALFSVAIHQRPPSTDSIVRLCQMLPAATLVTTWTDVWHKALLVSVASHLPRAPLAACLPAGCAQALERDYARLLPKLTPLSAYSQVTQIISQHGSPGALARYLADPRWDALEHTLAQALPGCPPLCFFYDAVDEEFERAPMYWLPCQQGLFYAVMNLLRDARFGGRLHLFISLRDLVLAAVLQSEHRGRYESEPHIRTLNWNRKAISYLLAAKLQRLGSEHLLLDDGQPSLRTWLGQDAILNKARGVHEPLDQYLLRHTLLLPRDVVVLGNDLCAAVARQRAGAPDAGSFDDTIRAVVSKRARKVGDEQLTVCANHISSNSIPAGAARLDYAHVYTADKAYVKGVVDDLKRLIASIGRERFGADELHAAQVLAAETLGEQSHVFNVLWQNGLLGYMEKRADSESRVFYSEELMDYFTLPERREYVFHPCLIDAVGIRSIGRSVD